MSMSWLKTGESAQKAHQSEEARAEKQKQEAGKMWRFWIKPGTEAKVLFCDGDLDADGVLMVPSFYEHSLQINGKWGNNYICTADQEPCPICAAKDTPSYVGVLTVLDMTPWTDKEGKLHTDGTPKLYVMKRGTLNKLRSLAAKRGGLTGCIFDISRTSEKDASVGDMFDFVEKLSPADFTGVRKKFLRKDSNGQPVKNAQGKFESLLPANYEKELIYRDAATLISMGVGVQQNVIGKEKPLVDDQASNSGYDGEL